MKNEKDAAKDPEKDGKAAKAAPEEPEKTAEKPKAEKPEEKKAEPAEKAASDKKPKKLSELDVLKMKADQLKAENGRLQNEIEKAQADARTYKAQADALNTKLANTLSEYENYRRRTASEKEALGADVTAKAAKALLPALDNLTRALDFAESNPESFRKGVEMTLKQLESGFSSLGVKEIETETGETFDPGRHNAVAHVDDDSLGESVVAEVFQKGYVIGDKVIRHTVVKVAN